MMTHDDTHLYTSQRQRKENGLAMDVMGWEICMDRLVVGWLAASSGSVIMDGTYFSFSVWLGFVVFCFGMGSAACGLVGYFTRNLGMDGWA
jgi:hypothetical protein